jgi:hypothetical protein
MAHHKIIIEEAKAERKKTATWRLGTAFYVPAKKKGKKRDFFKKEKPIVKQYPALTPEEAASRQFWRT